MEEGGLSNFSHQENAYGIAAKQALTSFMFLQAEGKMMQPRVSSDIRGCEEETSLGTALDFTLMGKISIPS